MQEIITELENITKAIVDSKEEKARAEGILSEYLKTLNSMGLKTEAAGKKKIKTLENKLSIIENKIVEKFNELKEKYEW